MSASDLRPGIARPVSGLERVWFAAGAVSPFLIATVMAPDFEGPDSAWRAATDALGVARPGTRLRWVGWLRRARWVVDPSPIPLRRVPDWDGVSPAPFLDAPLDPITGPTVEVVLAGRFVVLRAHHAVTDGRGLWAWAQALLDALGGAALPPGAAGPYTELDLVEGVEAPPYTEPALDAPSPFPHGPTGVAIDRVWRHRSVPAGRQISARVAACLVAHAGVGLRLSVPVDLRRYAPHRASDANLTGIAHVELPAGVTVDAAHAQLLAAVEAGRAVAHVRAADGVRGVPLWLVRWAARRAGRMPLDSGRFAVSVTLSNMGRLPLSLRGAPVPAFVLPPVNPSLPLFVALVGGHDCVAITVVAPRAWADDAALDGLLDVLSEAL